jgi:hypothetical protein
VLLVADLGRLIALGSIPVASAIASVTLPHLFVVAFVTGVFTVFFDVAYQSYLPELVGLDHLVEGNAKLTATESAAHVAGPGVAGALIGAVGAVTAIVADAISYAVSFVCVIAIRRPSERSPSSADVQTSLVHDIGEGLRYVWHEHRIRAVAFCTATSNLFAGVGTAVVILLMSRELGFGSGLIGLVFAVGGIGGVLGAVAAPRLAEWFGVGKAIVWSIALGGIGPALIAIATGELAFALLGNRHRDPSGNRRGVQHQSGLGSPGDLSTAAARPDERQRPLPRVGHAPDRRLSRRRVRIAVRSPDNVVDRGDRPGRSVPLVAAVASTEDARHPAAHRGGTGARADARCNRRGADGLTQHYPQRRWPSTTAIR